MSTKTYLIVGLGNPGPDYSHNRHNVGQMVLDVLAKRTNATFKSHKAHALVAEAKLGQGFDAPKLVLAKSLGYMNTSGGPTANLLKFYDLKPDQLIVIHDELDIDSQQIRIKFAGGHAGHNGLRDIISAIGNDFIRVRVGIGRPPGTMEVSDFVLKDFSLTEKKELPTTLEIAADAVEAIVTKGLTEAQQVYHSQ
ncbi:MAG: aminoacyl-tRNA hydrolase [Micrococcales bacterium]|nr:aminoacyl-tRNA hydrolase [Microbacteriaceae bacterium]NBR23414.1 aminoacyl-tRNA hydrolase [Micrococcales bacterium]NBS61730.1 aminoacyl-tRNA hydrolase [Microbacteriaceae bacterium]NBX94268.1 aminoacyl-tRNA hydrolase [Actinomycetota bacterium]